MFGNDVNVSLVKVIGRCPTCGTRIGGKNHRMLRDNQRLGNVVNEDLKNQKIVVDDIERTYKQLKNENKLRIHSVDLIENESDDESDYILKQRADDSRDSNAQQTFQKSHRWI